MDFIYTASEIKEKYKITNQTLYNWRKNNKISYMKLVSGKFMYKDIIETIESKDTRKNVIYSRVSNLKQKEDLERQERILREFIVMNGLIVDEVFSDIASGMNSDRREFNKLIQECIDGKINKIFITYKDRFVRFGFEYFVNILEKFNVEIIVVNGTKEEDFQSELTQDLISIIHHFSMKIYSNRRKELKQIAESIVKEQNDNN